MRPWNCHRKSDSAYTHAFLGGGHHAIPPNACFNEHWYMKGIWMLYERHISSGGLLLVGSTLPGLPGLPSALGRFGPGTSVNLFGFDHRKSTNTRLGPAKVPQPGVDLIQMAAPERHLLAPSALPGSRHQHTRIRRPASACFKLPVYGMVDVALPWIKQGKRGTRPRRSSVLPT
jgi:hypothetical protein